MNLSQEDFDMSLMLKLEFIFFLSFIFVILMNVVGIFISSLLLLFVNDSVLRYVASLGSPTVCISNCYTT